MFKIPQRQVHLDFHTSGQIEGIGSRFDKEQFKRCLKKGHVNSITLFAKCHHGWAYFPSEENEMHPWLDFDLLGAQMEACREIGVKTPVYISGGITASIPITVGITASTARTSAWRRRQTDICT